MRYKIRTVIFIGGVMISAIFLIYAGDLYFKTYSLTYGVRVSIQTLNVEQTDSDVLLKNTFLLENPSSVSFKVTYIKEEIYDNSEPQTKLSEAHLSSLPGYYIIVVEAFSNATIDLRASLDDIPSNENLFILAYMRFDDIPIIGALYLKRYFSAPLNVSSEEGIH